MHNNNTTILGELEYNGKTYPFALINQFVSIIDSQGEYLQDFSDTEQEDYITGWDNNGNPIAFLGCKFEKQLFNTKTRFQIMGYLLFDNSTDFKFDMISFRSNAINTFYAANQSVDPILPDGVLKENEVWDGILGAKIKPFIETDVTIDCDDCIINLVFHRQLNYQKTTVLESIPELQVKTKETQDLTQILGWYLRIYDLLCFLNFRKDICFSEIKLYRKLNSVNQKIGKVIIFTSHNSNTYDSKELNSIVFNDIPKACYPALVRYIFNWRDNSTYNEFLYPNTRSEGKKLDNSKWLSTALSFEAVFEKKYPTFKSDNNSNFAIVKSNVLDYLTQQIESNTSKKQKEYYQKIYDMVNREGVLEEKFNYYIKMNKNELNDTIDILKNRYGISGKNIGAQYANKRNHLAHGRIEPPNDVDCFTFVLIRAIVYDYVFKEAGVPSDNIKLILKKLFER